MSVMGAAPVRTRSSPGTWVTISAPGLKPSLWFHSLTSMGVPCALRGMAVGARCTRRPVSVDGSGTVKKSLGNGRRQAVGSIGSQGPRWV